MCDISSAVACCLAVARAEEAVAMWLSQLTPKEVMAVSNRLGHKREWRALNALQRVRKENE